MARTKAPKAPKAGKNAAAEAKQKIKDSVFTHIFKEPEYLLELYQALHREDKTATEKDLKIVTIENVLVDQWYNDLGFLVRDILIVLVECQSIWALNIALRLFIYLANTYVQYITENHLNIHSRTKLVLPKPELYVIYTGERRKDMPEEISLADEFFGGDKRVMDVKIKVIYDGEKGDIINQYYTFTQVLKEQIGKYGRTRKAVKETIRICEERNVLKKFFQSREKEVQDIMTTLFSQESAVDAAVYESRQEGILEGRQKGILEGRQKGILEGRQKGILEGCQKRSAEIAYKLYKRGLSVKEIAETVEIPIKELEKWIKEAEKQEREHLN